MPNRSPSSRRIARPSSANPLVGSLKIFHGIVTMKPDDSGKPIVKPVMSHFFYMDEKDPTKVRHWVGAVGPVQF